MALKFRRQREVESRGNVGLQVRITPDDEEPPGTIFGIDSDGQRFLVEKLDVKVERRPINDDAQRVHTVELSETSLARVMGKVGGNPTVTRVVAIALDGAVQKVVNEPDLDHALADRLGQMQFRAGTRYYVIRETWSATSVSVRLTEGQLLELQDLFGDELASVTSRTAAVSEILRPFHTRLAVLFLPDEIAPVRSGLAGAETPQLGRVAVSEYISFSESDYALRRVFFATDRNMTNDGSPIGLFGTERSELRYGSCEVSIPRDHRMGQLEAPSVWKLQFKVNPAKHVALLTVTTTSRDQFLTDIDRQVIQSQSHAAFLFVHGYNVTFEDAARRTAQMSYDLGFDGAPIFYSWPSQGTTIGYTVDEQSSEWSEPHFRVVLAGLLERPNIEKLFLIAHSMGNRLVTKMLCVLLQSRPELRARLSEIILTAPDIDSDVFVRDIAPLMIGAGCSLSLYASSRDKALLASKKVHGGRRAGDTKGGVVVMDGIETIDASAVDTSFWGHGYFAERVSVIADMFYLIQSGQRAAKRFGLQTVDNREGRYWLFKP